MIGIYLLTIITEIIKLILIYHGLLGFPYRKGNLKYALLLLSLAAFCLLSFIPSLNTIFLSGYIVIISLILALFLFKESIKILLKVFICISVVTVTWDNLLTMVINLYYHFDDAISSGALIEQCLCNLLLLIILAVTRIIIKRRGQLHKLNYNRLSNTIYFLFLSSATLSAYINSLIYIIFENSNMEKKGVTYIAIFALSILFQIVCITLIFLFYSREQYKKLNQLREEYNEKQIDYYKTLLNQEEDTRKFRHDIGNHLICIGELLDTGKLSDLKSYIQDIHHSLEKIASIYDTGNDIINAILNYYAKKGMEEHIRIQVKGRIMQELNIPMMHLSTLVSNLMSNAYEAASRVNSDLEKVILVELRSGSKYLEIIVKNPATTNRVRITERAMTTKADKRNHGFGIQNIKEVLAKYDGELQLQDDLDSVTARIIMRIT